MRGWSDQPRLAINIVTGEKHRLNKKYFYVLESCDGKTNLNSLAFLPEHLAILDAMTTEGVVETCRRGDPLAPYQIYRKANNPYIATVHWCVTGRCNLHCLHCYMQSPDSHYRDLPLKELKRFIAQFAHANVLQVSITGGEPFMRKDLFELIDLLADKKIRVTEIYSNGLLIRKNHLDRLRNVGITPTFQISFDGVGAHDGMRGKEGIEADVIRCIELLRANDFPIVVATSIDNTNKGKMLATYELMKALGVRSWRLSRPLELGNWRGNDTALSIDDAADTCMEILNRWSNDEKPFTIQLAGFFSESVQSKFSLKKSSARDIGYTPDSYDCIACRQMINLLPDGTVVPCPGYVDTYVEKQMPNLRRENLATIWANSLLREIVDLKKQQLLDANPECATCDEFANCGIGCRAQAVIETGDIRAKDPVACTLWKQGYQKRFYKAACGES